ncbi:MAG: HipA family kinase [Segetibacter sp.]
MPILQSIEALDKGNIKETQNRPIMVHASDLNFYYCKYHGHVGAANKLFKEYIVAQFQQCWGFNHAPFCLMEVLPDHIPADLGIVRRSFDVPCFGLQAIEDAGDLNKVTEDVLTNSRKKRALKEDVLKLAFFDIWTCNEDWHTGNYNILYKLVDGSYVIYPIDHDACFNHGNFEHGLTEVTYQDNLIYSTFFAKLFKANELKNQERLENMKQTFYLCGQSCTQNVNNYLQDIPNGWNINIVQKEAQLNQYLLNDVWFETCWNTFLQFLEDFTNE